MILAGVCFLITCIAIEQGYVEMIVIFGALTVFLVYKRIKLAINEGDLGTTLQDKQLLNQAKSRFGDSSFVSLVLNELKSQNWSALNSCTGIEVRIDCIVIPNKKFFYIDHGLANLDPTACKELATYLCSFYAGSSEISKITHCIGGGGLGYSGYVYGDGSFSVSQGGDAEEIIDGYRILKKISKSTVPQGKKW